MPCSVHEPARVTAFAIQESQWSAVAFVDRVLASMFSMFQSGLTFHADGKQCKFAHNKCLHPP